MKSFYPKSVVEQLAGHLRAQIQRGQLSGTMPGVNHLVKELGVGTETVIAALDLLEREGSLMGQGPRRRRKILPLDMDVARPGIRVVFLLYEPNDYREHYLVELRHQLSEAGHSVQLAPKALSELGMDAARVERMVRRVEADAWVVVAGSRGVLEWFSNQPIPAFALFGRMMQVPMAGTSPRKAPACRELVERLVGLGHRRIVMLAREERRKPNPGFLEQFILEELERHGIQTGAYNLPDWEDSPEGLHRILDSLFEYTAPTALLVDEATMLWAVRMHLAKKAILTPQHVSLISMDSDPSFTWSRPTISHIRWDERPIVRRMVQWVNNVAMGKEDQRTTATDAEFIPGGTIGPAAR
jgi:DNA-binding LacI/PurR family transcriptional regulator